MAEIKLRRYNHTEALKLVKGSKIKRYGKNESDVLNLKHISLHSMSFSKFMLFCFKSIFSIKFTNFR